VTSLSSLISPPGLKSKDKRVEKDSKISQWAKGVLTTTKCSPRIDIPTTPIGPLQSAEEFESLVSDDIASSSDGSRTDSEYTDIWADSDTISGGEISRDPLPWDSTGVIMAKFERYYAIFLGVETVRRLSSMYQAKSISKMTGNEPSEHLPTQSSASVSSKSPSSKGKLDQTSSGTNKGQSDQAGNENDGSQPVPPSKRYKQLEGDPSLRFACPFFKRYPVMFRRCGIYDHKTPSRVKQHIQRQHRRPIYCPRCSVIFKSEDERGNHVREYVCTVKVVKWHCATTEQLHKLSKRSTAKTDRQN
jgi:hypothetical protein